AVAAEGVEFLADFRSGERIFGPVLDGRIAREIATPLAGIADRPALAEESEDHQVVPLGRRGGPLERLEAVRARGRLAVPDRILLAQQQTDVFALSTQVVLVAEQVLARFDIGLGVR